MDEREVIERLNGLTKSLEDMVDQLRSRKGLPPLKRTASGAALTVVDGEDDEEDDDGG